MTDCDSPASAIMLTRAGRRKETGSEPTVYRARRKVGRQRRRPGNQEVASGAARVLHFALALLNSTPPLPRPLPRLGALHPDCIPQTG